MENNEIIENDNVRPIVRKFINWWKMRFSVNEDISSAESSYCKATYGQDIMDSSTVIKIQQHAINDLIREKLNERADNQMFSDYSVLYSVPKNMSQHVDEIIKPFIDKGYKVINLSELTEEIICKNVFLITFYKEQI